MKPITFILYFLISSNLILAQNLHLKSIKHALRMMNEDIAKDSIIHEIRFKDGEDDTVGVVRFDNVYLGRGPLIISAKTAVATDVLGLLSITLPADTLENFLWLVDKIMPQSQKRDFDRVLLRVTYRYHSVIKQYYITNRLLTTGYLMRIEREIRNNGNPQGLKTFYKFVSNTGLVKGVRGKPVWKEAN